MVRQSPFSCPNLPSDHRFAYTVGRVEELIALIGGDDGAICSYALFLGWGGYARYCIHGLRRRLHSTELIAHNILREPQQRNVSQPAHCSQFSFMRVKV